MMKSLDNVIHDAQRGSNKRQLESNTLGQISSVKWHSIGMETIHYASIIHIIQTLPGSALRFQSNLFLSLRFIIGDVVMQQLVLETLDFMYSV